MDNVNKELKSVNMIYDNLFDDIKKLNENFDDLLDVNNINKELKYELNKDNYILAEINVKENDVNKKIKILGSYEEFFRKDPEKLIEADNFENENDIKKCEIKINDEIIPFNYYHRFKSKGRYIIKYSFKTNMKSTCLLFKDCKLIKNINLSHFNSSNIIYSNSMLYGCSSLDYINFSNFNTNKVININNMFRGCSSLKNINISEFNTNNVTDIGCLFDGCSSLININLFY